jgi:peroxiredoxin
MCAGGRTEVEGGLKAGDDAPQFALPDIKGKQVSLEEYRGKPVVLNFWAFWCDTWKAELPYLKELAPRRNEIGFRMLAISVDGTRLQEFQRVTEGKTPFPVLLDVGGKVSAQYHIAHVPTVVILDGVGKVRYVKVGYPGNEAVLHQLRRLVSPASAGTATQKATAGEPKAK